MFVQIFRGGGGGGEGAGGGTLNSQTIFKEKKIDVGGFLVLLIQLSTQFLDILVHLAKWNGSTHAVFHSQTT